MPRAPVSDDAVDEVGALNAVRPAGMSGRGEKLLGLNSGGRIDGITTMIEVRGGLIRPVWNKRESPSQHFVPAFHPSVVFKGFLCLRPSKGSIVEWHHR